MNKAKTRETVTSRVNILLVEDHPIVRRGMATLIREDPQLIVCGETGHAAEAVQLVERLQPDLAIIDLSLKGGSGLELIKQIKAQFPDVKMLVSSMHNDWLFAERVLHAGALGYVNKDATTDHLLEAIHEVIHGRIYLDPKMANRMLRRVVEGKSDADGSPISSLSDRELEVFQMLGQGLTTREIAAKLHLSTKTVDTYREHLKNKLELKNSSQLIRYAVEWTQCQP